MGEDIKEYIQARLGACRNHPEKREIFLLEKLLIEAGYPYFFNLWEDLRPTPFDQEEKDPETAIDWERYNFTILMEDFTDWPRPIIAVYFSVDKKLLTVEDVEKGIKYDNYTAEQAMEYIKSRVKY